MLTNLCLLVRAWLRIGLAGLLDVLVHTLLNLLKGICQLCALRGIVIDTYAFIRSRRSSSGRCVILAVTIMLAVSGDLEKSFVSAND